MSTKTVAFQTLGCKVNQYDTDAVTALFKEAGYTVVDFHDQADVYVINTCTVTNIGDKKSRQVIRRAHRQNPDGKIVVMGCMSQASPGEVEEIDGVNLVVGTNERSRIVELIDEVDRSGQKTIVSQIFDVQDFEELHAEEFSGRTRATLKIQDGCNEFCSYCRVPFARGKSRSRQREKVVAQVQRLVEKGYKEIVLTGVHLGAYGKDLSPRLTLSEIIEEICDVPGVKRVRISSIDPHEIDDGFLKLVAENPKVCRHLHIPLQSGSDAILKNMRRKYTTADFASVVTAARKMIPGLAVTTDVIVGFPGETAEEFKTTRDFIAEMAFSRLHVFKYSPRKDTPAARFTGQVSSAEKDKRSAVLLGLSNKLATTFHKSLVGSVVQVLVEELKGGVLEGLTDTYVRVQFSPKNGTDEQFIGELVNIQVESSDEQGIRGIDV